MTTLSPHVHTATLTDPDQHPHLSSVTIVWSDRPYYRCPRCQQEVQQIPDRPVVLDNASGEVSAVSQQHGCGEWLSLRWCLVSTPQEVSEAADALAAAYEADVYAGREETVQRLTKDLRGAPARLREPLEAGESPADREAEITTGRDDTPGIYREEGHLLAWDFDPSDGENIITVHEADVKSLP